MSSLQFKLCAALQQAFGKKWKLFLKTSFYTYDFCYNYFWSEGGVIEINCAAQSATEIYCARFSSSTLPRKLSTSLHSTLNTRRTHLYIWQVWCKLVTFSRQTYSKMSCYLCCRHENDKKSHRKKKSRAYFYICSGKLNERYKIYNIYFIFYSFFQDV